LEVHVASAAEEVLSEEEAEEGEAEMSE